MGEGIPAGLILENFPPACRAQECIIGVDEAGRGPVLGPLVYGLFVCPGDSQHLLTDLGAGDSKEKTVGEREAFYGRLPGVLDRLGWKATVLHPEHISNCMLRREKYNLNTLSYDTVFALIQCALDNKISISHGYIDTLGPADKYQARLTERFPGIKFTVKSKADSLFPVVGAASIVAKVTRDRVLDHWVEEECGSGYPGDPNTVAWLKKNAHPVFGFGSVVRFSWSSCDRILAERCAAVTWPKEDDPAAAHNAVQSFSRLSAFCGHKPVVL